MSLSALRLARGLLRPVLIQKRAASYGLRGEPSNPDPMESLGAWREKPLRKPKAKGRWQDRERDDEPGADINEVDPDGRGSYGRDSYGRGSYGRNERTRPEVQPSRTLFIRGIGYRNTNSNADVVREMFKAVAQVENVRMGMHFCHIDVRTTKEGYNLYEEHRRSPFYHDGRRLFIDYAETVEHANTSETLYLTNFTGGEQEVRKMLKSWEEVIESVRGGKREDKDVAWVKFRTHDAAEEALRMLWGQHPHLSVEWARSESARTVDGADEPSDTLCLVGFLGRKAELRRHIAEWKQAILDIRIPAEHENAGRWDFVFVRFKTKERAMEARRILIDSPHFRVRYAVAQAPSAPEFSGLL